MDAIVIGKLVFCGGEVTREAMESKGSFDGVSEEERSGIKLEVDELSGLVFSFFLGAI
jgi:hypothetical protein